MLKKLVPGVLVMCLLPSLAQGSLRLSDFFIDLHPERRAGALFAKNEGSEALYLKIDVVEVLDPTEADSDVRRVDDPRELGLLVSPQRLVLQPGEEGRIRALALTDPDGDRFYKVSVVPVAGTLNTETPVGIKVMIGYSAWVYVRPEGAKPELKGVRKGNSLTLTNTGDTLAQLVMGKQCTAVRQCEQIQPMRVLAGRRKHVELPFVDGSATFRMVWGDQSQDLMF